MSVRCPQFQRSSPLKPLVQSKPNFMWSIPGKGGELIGWPCSVSVRRPQLHVEYPWEGRRAYRMAMLRVCPSSTISKIFSSETACPIKAKVHVEYPWEGGTEVYINGPGHLTKMATMPIYGKNHKKSSSLKPMDRFQRNLVCSIGDSCPL